MVRRHEDTAFMGGAHVFPGGRVDAVDGDADESWCDGVAHATTQLDGLEQIRGGRLSRGGGTRAVRRSRRAARQTSGRRLRVPRGRSGSRAAQAGSRPRARGPDDPARRDRARAVAAGARRARPVRALGDAAGRHPPVRHAVFHDTRAGRTRRRRTTTPRPRTVCGHVPRMPSRSRSSGEIVLPPPTWSTLRELEPFESVKDALAWARRRTVVRRMPKAIEQDGHRMLAAAGRPAASRSGRRRSAARDALRAGRSPLARRTAAHVESARDDYRRNRGARKERGEQYCSRSLRSLRFFPVVLLAFAATLGAQSRALVAPEAAAIYQRLLPQVSRIKIFDHHAHPGFAGDEEVDPAPVPEGAMPLRLSPGNPDWAAAARRCGA